jgi:hypothetical protein
MKTLIGISLLFTTLCAFADHHEGQHKMGSSTEWEIKAYTSAAPEFIGKNATVIGASGKVLREGTNGWRCEPFVPMPAEGFETPRHASPGCSDKNAVAWASAYKANTNPVLEGDGWIWMLNGDLGADNFKPYTDGQKNEGHKHYIEAGAHLMLMPKDPSSMDGQSTDHTTGAPFVMFVGTPYAHLMIPANGFYDYQPQSAPK